MTTKVKFVALFILIVSCLIIYINYNQKSKMIDQPQENAKILIYTKSYCGYCAKAKQFLKEKNLLYKEIDITNDDETHDELKTSTNQNTVPYIFIQNKLIGGFSDLSVLSDQEIEQMMK